MLTSFERKSILAAAGRGPFLLHIGGIPCVPCPSGGGPPVPVTVLTVFEELESLVAGVEPEVDSVSFDTWPSLTLNLSSLFFGGGG